MPIGVGDVHIDTPLSNLSVAYNPVGIIAPDIAPVVPVDKQSDLYYIWGKENFKVPETARAPKTLPRRLDYSVSSAQYFCKQHALRTEVAYETNANADAVLNLIPRHTEMLAQNMAQAWENRLAGIMTNTSNVGSYVSLTNGFSNPINSDPIKEIDIGLRAPRAATGLRGNTVIIGDNVWSKLMQHPGIQQTAFPHGGGIVTPDILGQILTTTQRRPVKVYIAEASKNTANENATDAFADIWGDNVWIGYINPSPGINAPSYMYTFRWTPANFPAPMAVEIHNVERQKMWDIQTYMFQDEKVVASELGYLITSAA